MAQNYRNPPHRPEDWRGARYQTGSERERYRTGGEQRFHPDWDERGRHARAFEGDRSYSRGGYSEEFGYRRDQNRATSGDYRPYAGTQSFRGRGPRGYRRSDERLKEMVCERLTDDPWIDASDVAVDVTGQIVKLTGTVDDRATKYEIEELIETFGGVKDIDNQLRVQSSRPGFEQSSGTRAARGGSDWEAGSSTGTSSGA